MTDTEQPSDRPTDCRSAPQAYQCKTTQSTEMATQIQLAVILAGNRIATPVSKQRQLTSQKRRKRKAEIVSVSVLPQALSLD